MLREATLTLPPRVGPLHFLSQARASCPSHWVRLCRPWTMGVALFWALQGLVGTHGHALSAPCCVETEAQRSQAAGPRSHSESSEELGLHRLQAQPAPRPRLLPGLLRPFPPRPPLPGTRRRLTPPTSLSAGKLLPRRHRWLCGRPAHGPRGAAALASWLAGRFTAEMEAGLRGAPGTRGGAAVPCGW